MGKLPENPRDSASVASEPVAERRLSLSDKMRRVDEAKAARGGLAIALDATGSMESLLDMAKATLAEILSAISTRTQAPIRARIYAFRDYDCINDPDFPILEVSGMSDSPEVLVQWLGRVRAGGGGGNEGEAIEIALQSIIEANEAGAIILAGDEPSNPHREVQRAQRVKSSALELATALGRERIPIYAFQVGQDPRTTRDFQQLASRSGGAFGRLSTSRDMIEMAVLAVLKALQGAASARAYASATSLGSNAKDFAALLLTDGSKK